MSAPVRDPKGGGLKRLYHGDTNVDIVGRWKLWFAISGVLLLLGIARLATGGLTLGIDFTGGTVWQVEAGDAEVEQVQDAMEELGYDDVQVQEVTQATGGGNARFLRVEAEASAEPADATRSALRDAEDALGGLRGDVPADARGRIDDVREDLEAVDGPFADEVPAPLASLQAEIEKLPSTLEGAEDAPAAARRAADRMSVQITDLSELEDAERARIGGDVTERLAELTGTPATEITVDTVGPSWGRQISEKARNALVVFMIAITIFITIRFELKMAIATVVALFHDLLVVLGLYSLFGFPVTPATVVALLTMLGFSIYDGIVVFDRVNENTKLLDAKGRMTYSEMANRSLNQVLMRSLNTSITSLLPILSVLIVGAFVLGASTLQEFGLALFLGLLSGAYSSIFIATPLLALLKEREPRYRELRRQIAERGSGSVPQRAEVVKTEAELDPVMASVKAGPTAPYAPSGTPRPRKQGRRR
ncbi:MAG TPA: protein translocase subunit SecF [Aquihabitans sp.]|nr:protein translocase subunit SecF [Aquihabitans sp.]